VKGLKRKILIEALSEVKFKYTTTDQHACMKTY